MTKTSYHDKYNNSNNNNNNNTSNDYYSTSKQQLLNSQTAISNISNNINNLYNKVRNDNFLKNLSISNSGKSSNSLSHNLMDIWTWIFFTYLLFQKMFISIPMYTYRLVSALLTLGLVTVLIKK